MNYYTKNTWTNIKTFMMYEVRQKEHIVWYYFHKIIENTN